MKVLAVDPGIANLSVCVLENGCILYWDTIHILSENIFYEKKCTKTFKNSKKCNRHSKYIYRGESTCAAHRNALSVPIFPDKKIKNVTHRAIVSAIEDVFNRLTALDQFRSIDKIVIEDQRKSTEKIKFTAACIFSALYRLAENAAITFVKGSCKLKGHEINTENTPRSRYARNKCLAKRCCANLLSQTGNDAWKVYYESFAKKDDLADSYLLALYASGRVLKRK